jgi:hypothetical protein
MNRMKNCAGEPDTRIETILCSMPENPFELSIHQNLFFVSLAKKTFDIRDCDGTGWTEQVD